MQLLGHGIDIENIDRVRRLLEMPGSEWVVATFSLQERGIADSTPHDVQYYAGRFAAKEAVAKAIGTGISGEIAWIDIEILRQPSGNPYVSLSEEAKRLADAMGISRWLLSISHSDTCAIASAIAISE